MMLPKTKRIAGLSLLLLLGMAVVVVSGVWFINQQSIQLAAQAETIATDQAQKAAFSRLQHQLQATQADRDKLQSYFLVSRSDSVDFLNYVEALATDNEVTLKTNNPSETERGEQAVLTVDYTISGTLAQVEKFIELLELIPYVSQLQSIALRKQTEVVWEANVTIDVILLNYE